MREIAGAIPSAIALILFVGTFLTIIAALCG